MTTVAPRGAGALTFTHRSSPSFDFDFEHPRPAPTPPNKTRRDDDATKTSTKPIFPPSSYPYLPPYPLHRSSSTSSKSSLALSVSAAPASPLEPPLSAPPQAPLPPLPSTPSAVTERAALAFAATARRSTASSGLSRCTSMLSVQSSRSDASASAPSLAEFGVLREPPSSETRSRRGRPPRALRIDIPALPGSSSTVSTGTDTLGSLGSLSSLGPTNAAAAVARRSYFDDAPAPRAQQQGIRSPTGSVFSIATTRSAAESLREHVSGLLATIPAPVREHGRHRAGSGASASALAPAPSVTVHTAETTRPQSPVRRPYPQPRQPHLPNRDDDDDDDGGPEEIIAYAAGLLTAEDLHADPLLARSVTPITPDGGESLDIPKPKRPVSPSPLELSSLARTLRAMRRSGARSPLEALQSVSPEHDSGGRYYKRTASEDEGEDDEDDDYGAIIDQLGARRSFDLLNDFPATPLELPGQGQGAHQHLKTPSPSPRVDDTRLGVPQQPAVTTITRTLSQSLRKPLPPAPAPAPSSPPTQQTPRSPSPPETKTSSPPTASASSISISPSAVHDTASPRRTPRPPRRRGRDEARGGAASPDITTIICATPKPKPSASASASRDRFRSGSFATSTPVSRRESGRARSGSVATELEDAYAGIVRDSVEVGVAAAGDFDLSAYTDPDPDPDPSTIANPTAPMGVDELGVLRDRLQKEVDAGAVVVEEEESAESDSDIDLHTPLPHILLRAGVLSPHSKVLTGDMPGGRDSVASYMTGASLGSVMTKSGLYKDERDTQRRRQRHRDGKLLREGLGLTTGLGWSDSEDEDAPSALTSKLSKLALSSKSSQASLRSQKSMAALSSKLGLAKSTSAISRAASTATSKSYAGRSSLASTGSSSNASASPHPLFKSVSASSWAERTAPSAFRENISKPGAVREQSRDGESSARTSRTSEVFAGQRSMSPSPVSGMTSSSSVSLPFPPTPRDEPYDSAGPAAAGFGASVLSSSAASGMTARKSESVDGASTSGSMRAKTPTALRKPSCIATPSRQRTISSSKSAPPSSFVFSEEPTLALAHVPIPAVPRISTSASASRLTASTSSSSSSITHRPLRLPALQQKKTDGDRKPLQPGQPAPRSGRLLGYNRDLHDRQRVQQQQQPSKLATPAARVARTAPASPASPNYPVQHQSTASSPATSEFGVRRPTGLRAPITKSLSGLREPSPSRLSAPIASAHTGAGNPRTGTGMVYRQTSLPASRGATAIRQRGLV